MATFMERLAFLQKVPTLMKATADDESPCPGYLFQEIGKISHESSGCGQCLLEYLLERLQVESCHVKLKVLKIFVHLCGHGPSHFLTELRRNSTFIQQASVYSGPPDPIHGTALYQKVRNTAQDVARLLFTDVISTKNNITKSSPAAPAMGMGSSASHRSLQGFGYSSGKQGTGSDSLLNKIQKAAEVVASAVLPPAEQQGIRLHDNYYRAVAVPSAPIEVAVPACAYNEPARRPKAASRRCPGQVGGGWEETDSSNGSSNNSSQDMTAHSKSAGTGSRSGASRESSGDLSERVEALQLGDCAQEVALINQLTTGSRVFLCREESQHLIKECSTLNCEVVVELLSNKLLDSSHTVIMRALCAVACLMTSDLISLEQMFRATQRRLLHLAEGPPGPVANKATKMLRQFEALLGGGRKDEGATVKELHSSSLSEHLLHTLSGEDTDLTRNQPDISPTVITHAPHYTTTSFTQSLICSTEELENGPVLPARTGVEDSGLSSSAAHGLNTLSLFSGMELVTKGRLSSPQTSYIESEQSEHRLKHSNSSDFRENTSLTHNNNNHSTSSLISDHSQSASAFSFLHF